MTLRSMLAIGAVCLTLLAHREALGQSCTVSSPGVTFGVYNPMALSPVNATATVTVTCSANSSTNVSYAIQIGPGVGGSFSARSMSGLRYQLYADGARTQIWGDGTGGTTFVPDGYIFQSQIPVNRTYTIYAQLPALQTVAPGVYADLVVLMVIY